MSALGEMSATGISPLNQKVQERMDRSEEDTIMVATGVEVGKGGLHRGGRWWGQKWLWPW
ncbi:rCG55711, partial [Rattus norvegicus]